MSLGLLVKWFQFLTEFENLHNKVFEEMTIHVSPPTVPSQLCHMLPAVERPGLHRSLLQSHSEHPQLCTRHCVEAWAYQQMNRTSELKSLWYDRETGDGGTSQAAWPGRVGSAVENPVLDTSSQAFQRSGACCVWLAGELSVRALPRRSLWVPPTLWVDAVHREGLFTCCKACSKPPADNSVL